MNTNQERKASLLVRQDLKLTYALSFIIASLVSFALLTTLVGPVGQGLPAKAGHSPVDPACTSFCLDNGGHCAAVEFLEGKAVFHTGEAMPVKTLTNHAYLEAAGAWQAGRLRGNNSLERFGIAADRVIDFRPGNAPAAVAYAFESLNQTSLPATASSPTQWSLVFDTENLRIHFRRQGIRKVSLLGLYRLCR